MFNKEIPASEVKADPFPFPCEGDITLAARNTNYGLGPLMLHLVMKPGAVIRRTSMKGLRSRST